MKRAQPTAAQRTWMEMAYGMFLHFGPNTYEGKPWGDGKFPASKVDLRNVDTRQWARMAADAGMKYAVLTSKHHDGYCLWPSKLTEYCVRNSPGRRDVVGEFAEAFRQEGLKVGLYYSLWDRNFPRYEDDTAYAAYMREQMSELLRNYGEIVQIWFDGGWDKDYPSRNWEYDVSMGRDWFYVDESWYVHPSAATICDWYRRARKTDANLLFNLGPAPDGKLPEYHRPYLLAAAKQLFR